MNETEGRKKEGIRGTLSRFSVAPLAFGRVSTQNQPDHSNFNACLFARKSFLYRACNFACLSAGNWNATLRKRFMATLLRIHRSTDPTYRLMPLRLDSSLITRQTDLYSSKSFRLAPARSSFLLRFVIRDRRQKVFVTGQLDQTAVKAESTNEMTSNSSIS